MNISIYPTLIDFSCYHFSFQENKFLEKTKQSDKTQINTVAETGISIKLIFNRIRLLITYQSFDNFFAITRSSYALQVHIDYPN